MLWGVWKERHLTCTLQSNGQFMLMLRAVPGLSSWLNLGAIRDESAQPVHLLVVDDATLIATK
jgi:hypothetical protein